MATWRMPQNQPVTWDKMPRWRTRALGRLAGSDSRASRKTAARAGGLLFRPTFNWQLTPSTPTGAPSRQSWGPYTGSTGKHHQSLRARQIASQLASAREPLSLFEMMEWMGHRHPASTLHYVRRPCPRVEHKRVFRSMPRRLACAQLSESPNRSRRPVAGAKCGLRFRWAAVRVSVNPVVVNGRARSKGGGYGHRRNRETRPHLCLRAG
jgi:hypothetical protein